MSGEGKHRDAPFVEFDGNFADGLGGVAEEGNLVALGNSGDLLDGIKGSDFVVGGHDTEEVEAASAGLFEMRNIEVGLAIDLQKKEFDSALLVEGVTKVEHGAMFDRGNGNSRLSVELKLRFLRLFLCLGVDGALDGEV